MGVAREPGSVASFRLNITVAILVGFAGAILIVAFVVFAEHRQTLAFAAAVAAAMGAVYSGYYVAESLRTRSRQDRIARSFDFLQAMQDIQIVEVRTKLRKQIDQGRISPDDLYDEVAKDLHTHSALKATLNWFESISLAVQAGHVDEEILYRDLRTVLPWTATVFRPYIDRVRINYNDQKVFCELEKLANAWSNRTLLSTGEAVREPEAD